MTARNEQANEGTYQLKINGNASLSMFNMRIGIEEMTTVPILLTTASEISSAHLSLVIVWKNFGYLCVTCPHHEANQRTNKSASSNRFTINEKYVFTNSLLFNIMILEILQLLEESGF
jgi:hypothetical protein